MRGRSWRVHREEPFFQHRPQERQHVDQERIARRLRALGEGARDLVDGARTVAELEDRRGAVAQREAPLRIQKHVLLLVTVPLETRLRREARAARGRERAHEERGSSGYAAVTASRSAQRMWH